jgi:hypothetical protein
MSMEKKRWVHGTHDASKYDYIQENLLRKKEEYRFKDDIRDQFETPPQVTMKPKVMEKYM